MTITLTKDELYQFQADLVKWYVLRSEYIINNVAGNHHLTLGNGPALIDQVRKFSDRFEEENPRPDWRSLL